MEKLREELDNIFLDVEKTRNLALLLEDYFYDNRGDKTFYKNASLASIVVEQVKHLDERLMNLYDMTKDS